MVCTANTRVATDTDWVLLGSKWSTPRRLINSGENLKLSAANRLSVMIRSASRWCCSETGVKVARLVPA